MFKKPTPDILSEKVAAVHALTVESENAVDLVSRTISRLELINQQLDDAMAEIDTYTADLARTRESMVKQHGNNSAIIANFTKLLSIGE